MLLALTACNSLSEPVEPRPMSAPAKSTPQVSPVAKPVLQAALTPEPEPIVVPEPSTLVGMKALQVAGLLGEPSLMRTDKPAQIWQYRTDDCAFNLFLYQETGHTSHSVAHYEAVPFATVPNQSVKSCLGSILQNKAAG